MPKLLRSLTPILASTLMLATAGSATAASVTYTSYATPASLGNAGFTLPALAVTQFDPSLGTLYSVTISSAYAFSVSAVAGPVGGHADFYFSGNEKVGGVTNGSLTVNCNNSASGSANQDFSYTMNCGLSPVTKIPGVNISSTLGTVVTGTGTVNVALDGQFQTPFGGPGTTVGVDLTSGSVTLTYDYTPTVPEPGTVWLLGAGVGMVALRRFRRA